jgi:hypothetical protein
MEALWRRNQQPQRPNRPHSISSPWTPACCRWVTWFWAYEASRYQVPPPSPHGMRDRILQAIVFGAWTIGVPALATGMWAMSAPLVSVGAWALFVGVALATLDSVLVVAPALRAGVARSRPAA